MPKAEEVQAERKEPAPADTWEVDETEPGEAEEPLPEPSAAEEAQDAETVAELQESGGWFGRLRQGLSRSRASFVGQLNAAVAEFRDVEDEEFWERVEEILISSDVGVPTTAKLVGELEQEALERNITSGAELRELMIERATSMLEGPVELDVSHEPTVILMVGVNGTGKTTTIGKLSRFLPGTKMFAAGDTFRAAAIEQLQQWGERTGTPVVARERGADAAAVAHEAVHSARREGTDVLLIDTAGIRPRGKVSSSVEVFSVMRAETSIRRADLCCLVIDASAGVTAQDKKIAGLVQDARKPCLIAVNKWDLVKERTADKEALNEFVAYSQLGQLKDSLDPRSFTIATFALCGFANFSSIGIQIGGIGALAPTRRHDLARLGFRAMIAGTLANFITATIAGFLL